MRIWFVTRHPGAVSWAQSHLRHVDVWLNHMDDADIGRIEPGDVVIGVLPMPIAARVCQKGAQYWALEILMPHSLRGRELSESQLCELNCRLQRFEARYVRQDACGLLRS